MPPARSRVVSVRADDEDSRLRSSGSRGVAKGLTRAPPRGPTAQPAGGQGLEVLRSGGCRRGPETLVAGGPQAPRRHEPRERGLDQLVAGLDRIEDLPPQDEVPAVDPEVRVGRPDQGLHPVAAIGPEDPERVLGRAHREERGDGVRGAEVVDQAVQGRIREGVP